MHIISYTPQIHRGKGNLREAILRNKISQLLVPFPGQAMAIGGSEGENQASCMAVHLLTMAAELASCYDACAKRVNVSEVHILVLLLVSLYGMRALSIAPSPTSHLTLPS